MAQATGFEIETGLFPFISPNRSSIHRWLLIADLYAGSDLLATPERAYVYAYDPAGNCLSDSLALNGGSLTLTEYHYNAANQVSQKRIGGGSWTAFTYDDNGNLTADGVNDYSWDRANRLLEVDTGTPAELTAYAYDGVGNRISQAIGTSSPVVTQYLLDTQPGLAMVLRDSDGVNTNHYVHAPRGVHSRFDGSDWSYYTQDGLGSVRGVVDAVAAVTQAVNYTPIGVPDTAILGPAFTGEWRDESELQYHRARYMSPELGTFLSIDPFEGMASRPMSLNGYMYVEGDPVNMVDASGLIGELPSMWDKCSPALPVTSPRMFPSFQLIGQSNCIPTLANPFCISTGLEPGPDNQIGIITFPPELPDNLGEIIRGNIPDDTISLSPSIAERIQDLGQRCYNLDLEACGELSRLCDAGSQEACRQLSRAYRGDCSPWAYKPLREQQNKFCRPGASCTGRGTPENCARWLETINMIEGCITARRNINQTCYRGEDEEGHEQQIRNRQINLETCRRKYLAECANRLFV